MNILSKLALEYLIDPTILTGTITLIILEVILSIDNLLFITILIKKLPPQKREYARIIGLSLALIIRLYLLSLSSWIVTLTKPILNIASFEFSRCDLILLIGGFFLLFKALIELYRLLSSNNFLIYKENNQNNIWLVIFQIVIFDVIFSLDSIITAIGIINCLPLMMIAVVISMIVMLLFSRSLISFINSYRTIVIGCLISLLMIGINLIARGFNVHFSKIYLYIAICFSIIIELFHQLSCRRSMKK